jgi:hypothetical protein
MTASELQSMTEHEPEIESYRPLCGLAVTAFLLGLLAPLGIASAYLLLVPLAGALMAAASLRRIRASGDEFSGRRLALAGLLFSCFFGAWGIAQDVGRGWILSQEARRFCDAWLQLMVDGKTTEAYEWRRDPSERLGSDAALEKYYEHETQAADSRSSFFTMLPFYADKQRSTLREFRYLGNDSVTADEFGAHTIVHRYQITYEKNGKPVTGMVRMTVKRIPDPSSNAVYWQLQDIQAPRG